MDPLDSSALVGNTPPEMAPYGNGVRWYRQPNYVLGVLVLWTHLPSNIKMIFVPPLWTRVLHNILLPL